MSNDKLLSLLESRVENDKEEGDIAYFYALLGQLEYLTKVITSAIVALVADDADRNRYSLEYQLVRADSLGAWVQVLNSALTGPAARFFLPDSQYLVRDLTEKVDHNDPRYAAVKALADAANCVGADVKVGQKVKLLDIFQYISALRNRTRGHGAVTVNECTAAAPLIADSIERLQQTIQLFGLSWTRLQRNLSGKYRVTPLLNHADSFSYLKSTRDINHANGVYLYVTRPVRVPLISSPPDASDIFLPNGNFRNGSFEALSYITNDTKTEDGTPWVTPIGTLPSSETAGAPELDTVGHVFCNLPVSSAGYVHREAVEFDLERELLETERHPIISLTGAGGVGKTTTTLFTLNRIARDDRCEYSVILWMSSRDIDLLSSGPKPVAPDVLTIDDIAASACELLGESDYARSPSDGRQYIERCFRDGAAGPTLFVFDNFETVRSPTDAYQWIDTYIRPPNKALITTRFRDFAGDFPIALAGMTEKEALQLIDYESRRLGVRDLIDGEYERKLIDESDGHPYVIKILIGEVATERRAASPKRVIAGSDQLLKSLFERTFENLRPSSQRVFLLLSSWRAMVPEVAIEAVCLRPNNERFDVEGALNELKRFSLVEEVRSETDGEPFVGVPLAAAVYGAQKLEVSPYKLAVEEDKKLLFEFGAGKRHDVKHGVWPRIQRLFRFVAEQARESPDALETYSPVLEYIAGRVPSAYLELGDLVLSLDTDERARQKAEAYYRRYLQKVSAEERSDGWLRLAELCHEGDDAIGEVHALCEAALSPNVEIEDMGSYANRINNRIKQLKGRRVEDAWSSEVRAYIERLAQAMESRKSALSATDCSRLAWLHLNLGDEEKARVIAELGARRDEENIHCRGLLDRLS